MAGNRIPVVAACGQRSIPGRVFISPPPGWGRLQPLTVEILGAFEAMQSGPLGEIAPQAEGMELPEAAGPYIGIDSTASQSLSRQPAVKLSPTNKR